MLKQSSLSSSKFVCFVKYTWKLDFAHLVISLLDQQTNLYGLICISLRAQSPGYSSYLITC